MDPTANLKEQRQIVARIIAATDIGADLSDEKIAQDAARLAELVQALDAWITRGGFVPAQWHKAAR